MSEGKEQRSMVHYEVTDPEIVQFDVRENQATAALDVFERDGGESPYHEGTVLVRFELYRDGEADLLSRGKLEALALQAARGLVERFIKEGI